jgi:hypothetical protein
MCLSSLFKIISFAFHLPPSHRVTHVPRWMWWPSERTLRPSPADGGSASASLICRTKRYCTSSIGCRIACCKMSEGLRRDAFLGSSGASASATVPTVRLASSARPRAGHALCRLPLAAELAHGAAAAARLRHHDHQAPHRKHPRRSSTARREAEHRSSTAGARRSRGQCRELHRRLLHLLHPPAFSSTAAAGIQGSPNREPAGFLNRKYRTGIPVKPTGIPIGDFYQVW